MNGESISVWFGTVGGTPSSLPDPEPSDGDSEPVDFRSEVYDWFPGSGSIGDESGCIHGNSESNDDDRSGTVY